MKEFNLGCDFSTETIEISTHSMNSAEINFYIDAEQLYEILNNHLPCKTTFLALKEFLSKGKFPINYIAELKQIIDSRS